MGRPLPAAFNVSTFKNTKRACCSVPISPGATHQIVQDYLKYYGYGDTLHAFDQAAGLTDPVASTSGRYAVVPKHSEWNLDVLHHAHVLRTMCNSGSCNYA
jgi:hypothetical protein